MSRLDGVRNGEKFLVLRKVLGTEQSPENSSKILFAEEV
jgi:hypothetical protein